MRRWFSFRFAVAGALFIMALLLAVWGFVELATIWGFGYRDSAASAYIGYASTFFSASCLMLAMSLLALLDRRWRLCDTVLAALLLLSAAFEIVAGTEVIATGSSLAFAMVQYGVAAFFAISALGIASASRLIRGQPNRP